MRKLLKIFLVLTLLVLIPSCIVNTQKQLVKEFCYVGEQLYYTVEHFYQGELKNKSVVQYADNLQQDVYQYEYDKKGNNIKESIYSDDQLVYTLIYEYNDKLKTKMTYLDSNDNLYYYCDYEYDDKDNLICEKYYEQEQLVSKIEYKLIYNDDKISSKMKYANENLVSQTDFQYDKDGNITYQNALNLEQNIEYKTYNEYQDQYLVKSEHYEGNSLSGYVLYEYK